MTDKVHQTISDQFHSYMDFKITQSNLTTSEQKALKFLTEDPSIIIKPADKGTATVIMTLTDYIKSGLDQLSDNKYYQPILTSHQEPQGRAIRAILSQMLEEGSLDPATHSYLRPPRPTETDYIPPRDRIFYGLPKIHKEKQKWKFNLPPLRPIVSDCSSVGYFTNQYLETILHPLSNTHSSYLLNTATFLNKLSTLTISEDWYIGTLDVSSLYTNIPHQEGLQAVKLALDTRPILSPATKHILKLLEIDLTNNQFQFAGHHFRQVSGCAMGKSYAVSYANIFMSHLEDLLLDQFQLKPSTWWRYIDDVFLVWPHSLTEWETFLDKLNTLHPTITFEGGISRRSVNFLDTTVYWDTITKRLHHTIYWKPTDTHSLLSPISYHPQATRNAVISNAYLRVLRLCSTPETTEQFLKQLTSRLLTNQYPKKALRKAYRRARRTFLNETRPNLSQRNIVLTIPYHPFYTTTSSRLREWWPKFLQDIDNEYQKTQAAKLFPNPPLIAFSQPPKLKDILVSSKTEPHPEFPIPQEGNPVKFLPPTLIYTPTGPHPH